MKDGMKGKNQDGYAKMPKPDGKGYTDTNWDGGGGLGNKGKRWEGTGKECRGEAAKRGFGKS